MGKFGIWAFLVNLLHDARLDQWWNQEEADLCENVISVPSKSGIILCFYYCPQAIAMELRDVFHKL